MEEIIIIQGAESKGTPKDHVNNMDKYEGHTPGPWKFERGGGHAYSRIVGSESVHATGRTGYSGASYSDIVCYFPADVALPSPAANARLIADAPMLLEQRDKMLALLKEVSNGGATAERYQKIINLIAEVENG